MPREGSLRVFVSSTSEDLLFHRRVVREVVVECGHAPVMMQDFGAVAAHTVAACRGYVASADLVIALCAFRRGWVPTREQGGDGRQSVTGLEVEAARWLGTPVYWFFADKWWPGELYEESQEGRDWVKRFRGEVNQPAGWFQPAKVSDGAFEPGSLKEFRQALRDTFQDHRDALHNRTVRLPRAWAAAEQLGQVLPLLDEGLTAAPQVTAAALVAEYRRAAPHPKDIPATAGPIQAAYVCAADLAEAPRRADGAAPLLAFVRSAARLLPTHAARLTAWADATAARLGAPAVVLHQSVPPGAGADDGPPVRPDPAPRRPEVSAALRVIQPALDAAVEAGPGVTAEALRAAYEAAVPVGWAPRAEFWPDPRRAADEYSYNLAPATGPAGGAFPLLAFARAVLARVPADRRGALADAVREAARLLGETAPPVDAAPRAAAAGAARAPSYLLVAAARTRSDPTKYQIHGWLKTPGPEPDACLTDERAVFALDELPAALPGAIDQMRREAKDRTDLDALWVEVFLPIELLPQDVDRWPVTARWLGPRALPPKPLGTLHPVLVRAADGHFGDRAEREAWRRAVRERWAGPLRLTRHLPPADDGAGFVYHLPPAADIERLFDLLNGAPNVTGVALGDPAAARSGDWDALTVLVLLGVPVVAWSRAAPEAPDELTGLLVGDPAALPTRLHEFRKRAALAGGAHHGHTVAVLYDDPARLPPDVPLTTPEPLHG